MISIEFSYLSTYIKFFHFSESRRKNCQTTPCAESRVEAKLDNSADQIIITKNSASRKPRFPSKGKKRYNWARYFCNEILLKFILWKNNPVSRFSVLGGKLFIT